MEVKKDKSDQVTAKRSPKNIYEKLHPCPEEKDKLDKATAMKIRNEIYEKFYLRPDEENSSWFSEDIGVEVRVVPAGQEVEERFRKLLRIANGVK